MYLKWMDSNSISYLICDNDRDIRYRIKQGTFTDAWCVTEKDFYTQDFMVNGSLVTFALPW